MAAGNGNFGPGPDEAERFIKGQVDHPKQSPTSNILKLQLDFTSQTYQEMSIRASTM